GVELASRDGLKAEEEFIAWASTARRGGRWGVMASVEGLGADQVAAVERVLNASDRVLILQGDAGTGKTTCLKAVVAGIERAGGRVFGCAPSAGASDVLRKELTADADTLQQLLINESLQRVTRDRVLLVDEAGLISVREMRDLCRLAAANGNRLLLVGDIKQHSSVEAGDALRCLQSYAQVPVLRLTEIRRQKEPAYRKAVSLLARGQAVSAFNQFARLGAVKEIHDLPELFRAAAEDYVRTVTRGKSCLAISPVWSEVHSFTDEARRHLKAAGLLAAAERTVATVFPLKWTREERRRVENYQAGDVLSFHRDTDVFRKHEAVTVVRRAEESLVVRTSTDEELPLDPRRTSGFEVGLSKAIPIAVGDRLQVRANLKPLGLRNGDFVTVAGFSDDGSIALEDGRKVPVWFRHFSHGYATTSHAAQGKTIDHGILIMADAGISGGNLKQAYVSNSRFREDQMIFTSDSKLAREAMMRSGERKLAVEMAAPEEPGVDAVPARSRRVRVGPKPRVTAGISASG
ncbi:MAG: AAA family ATPase, partial [Opitutaceae bacterium]